MTEFSGFTPPRDVIFLRSEKFQAEIWPETGGAIANFDYRNPDGTTQPLFRPTEKKQKYMPTDLACWPLVPYSNRIAHAQFSANGQDYKLALNVANHPHALHGIGWQRPWKVLAKDGQNCRLDLSHTPDANWPFSFTAEQLFSLNANGLTLITSITNTGKGSMPYGLGQHPYIVRPKGTKLTAQVKGVWLTDDTVMPIEYTDLPPQWNLRDGCSLDGIFMDNCFDHLRGPARVQWPDGSSLEIGGSDNLDFLVVYNPPQENYVCVEPVSHMTDSVNRAPKGEKDTGHTVLAPGKSAQSTHSFSYKPAPV